MVAGMVNRLFGEQTLADFDAQEIEALWAAASAARDETHLSAPSVAEKTLCLAEKTLSLSADGSNEAPSLEQKGAGSLSVSKEGADAV